MTSSPNPFPATTLIEIQLANITNTLAFLARSRDLEIRKSRFGPLTPTSPAVMTMSPDRSEAQLAGATHTLNCTKMTPTLDELAIAVMGAETVAAMEGAPRMANGTETYPTLDELAIAIMGAETVAAIEKAALEKDAMNRATIKKAAKEKVANEKAAAEKATIKKPALVHAANASKAGNEPDQMLADSKKTNGVKEIPRHGSTTSTLGFDSFDCEDRNGPAKSSILMDSKQVRENIEDGSSGDYSPLDQITDEEAIYRVIKKAEEDAQYFIAEEVAWIQARRLVVTNIAAGAENEDVAELFSGLGYPVRDVTMLPQRDPVKRTQTAYVDMGSIPAAVSARQENLAYIFAHRVFIRLAIEGKD